MARFVGLTLVAVAGMGVIALGACGLSVVGDLDVDEGVEGGSTSSSSSGTVVVGPDGQVLDGNVGVDGGIDSGGDATIEEDGAPPLNCSTGGVACPVTSACENGTCVNVAANLVALRVDVPCTDDPQDEFCTTGQGKKSKAVNINGTSGRTYSIGIRVRGVVEQKSYSSTTNGNATGTNAGFFVQGGNPDTSNWNNYSLTINQPPVTYRLNRGSSNHDYCDPINYTATVRAQAGAVFELYGDSPNEGRSARNRTSSGQPIVVDGVPPAPAAFDGQFVQIDVESVAVDN